MSTEHIAKYRDLYRRLVALFDAGQGESPEADALRDEMDAPWYAMTRVEREQAISTELEAGPELDAAVAKACGYEVEAMGTACYRKLRTDEPRHDNGYCEPRDIKPFRPSINLDDAFEAAEKVGLFERYCLNKSPSGWDFRITCDEMCPPYLIEDCPTAPVAICRAILKLKGQ